MKRFLAGAAVTGMIAGCVSAPSYVIDRRLLPWIPGMDAALAENCQVFGQVMSGADYEAAHALFCAEPAEVYRQCVRNAGKTTGWRNALQHGPDDSTATVRLLTFHAICEDALGDPWQPSIRLLGRRFYLSGPNAG
ncbi:MAG: hypothetical protein M3O22_07230 [Pseudomonadota bacterium]|nr:hypothetical protein [Pseudomonadota bacterium]